MPKRRFRVPPLDWLGDPREAIRQVVLPIVTGLMRGKVNNTYDVTLTPSATTTTQQTEIATKESVAQLQAQSASAAVAVGAGVVWTECADGGVVTIHHDSSAATDRRFGLIVAG